MIDGGGTGPFPHRAATSTAFPWNDSYHAAGFIL